MSWLKRMLVGMLGKRRQRSMGFPLPACPSAPEWTAEHMMAMKFVLSQPMGQTMIARGRAIQFNLQTTACADVFHTQHSAGMAKGWGDCLNWLESLSRASREPEATTDKDESGEASILEHYSP